MRKPAFGFLILLAGWGLGWLTFHYWSLDQQPVRPPATITPIQDYPGGRAGLDVPAPAVDTVDTALLLQRNEFAAVLERYESLLQGGDEAAVANAKSMILAHVRQLIDAQRFSFSTASL